MTSCLLTVRVFDGKRAEQLRLVLERTRALTALDVASFFYRWGLAVDSIELYVPSGHREELERDGWSTSCSWSWTRGPVSNLDGERWGVWMRTELWGSEDGGIDWTGTRAEAEEKARAWGGEPHYGIVIYEARPYASLPDVPDSARWPEGSSS